MQAPPLSDLQLTEYDRIRIVGQGLTGSLLALELDRLSIPFIVQDTDLAGAATVVAPGIVNPLAGRNFSPPDNIDHLVAHMNDMLALAEDKTGSKIWNPCPILRMFAEPSQIDRFNRNLTAEEKSTFVEKEFQENSFAELNDVFGSFLTIGGGWADLPLLVEKVREWLSQAGLLDDSVWEEKQESKERELVIFCEGWQMSNNPMWSFIPHNPAKGEMLIVRFEQPLPRDKIYNQSCWVQPYKDDLWRVGATYSWSDFGSNPSLDGADDLQDRLHLLTSLPFHVEDHVAGVRPIVEDYRPVIGVHPDNPDYYILNAMGSKGVLQAPAAIKHLIEHLKSGQGIPRGWHIDRFNPVSDPDLPASV